MLEEGNGNHCPFPPFTHREPPTHSIKLRTTAFLVGVWDMTSLKHYARHVLGHFVAPSALT